MTGTPFPKGDQSVFGLHQLLGVDVKLVIVNSLFMRTDRPLPAEHLFEQLKRLGYLRNTPESVGAEVAGCRLAEQAPHVIDVAGCASCLSSAVSTTRQHDAGVDGSADSFSARFDALRRLLPLAVAEGGSQRLEQERSAAGAAGSRRAELDELERGWCRGRVTRSAVVGTS